QSMLSKLPLPTQAGQDNNFLATQINPIDQNLGTIRADYVINNASRFFARYTRQQGNSVLNVPAYGSLDYPGSNVAEGNHNSLVGVATWTAGAHSCKSGTDTLTTWRDRRDTSSQGDFGCANTGVCSGNGFSQQITRSPAAPGSGLSVATLLLGNASAFGRVIY